MPSQTDFDQGGTFRTLQRVWMGPSIGYVEVPQAILRVTGASATVQLGTTIVTVSFNGTVTIQLPKFKSAVPAISAPAPFTVETLTIMDEGLFAGANAITVLPGSGELISGLASAVINSAGGALVLQPDTINGGCTVVT